MRIFIVLILAVFILGAGAELYILMKERGNLQNEVNGLKSRLEEIAGENDSLKADIGYFSLPENLEKELRRKFNYRKPDEKMIITVP